MGLLPDDFFVRAVITSPGSPAPPLPTGGYGQADSLVAPVIITCTVATARSGKEEISDADAGKWGAGSPFSSRLRHSRRAGGL